MRMDWRGKLVESIFGLKFKLEFVKKINFENLVNLALDDLTSREKDLIIEYYKNDKPIREISENLGICRERAYQILRNAEKKIKYSGKIDTHAISRETKIADLRFYGMFRTHTCNSILRKFWDNNMTLGEVIDLIENGYDLSSVPNIGEFKAKEFLDTLKEIRQKFKF